MVHPARSVAFGRKGLSPASDELAIPMERQAPRAPVMEDLRPPSDSSANNAAPAHPKPDAKRKGLIATLLMPLFFAFKLFKLGKIGGTVVSMVLMLGVYTLRFGWRYSAGFIALLFLHEMGHYLAARRRGLKVGTPTFIPFVGAWIELKEQPRDAETEAYVGLAGPLVGSLGAAACYLLARENDSQLLLAVAYSGFFLNFFNLIPISPLDGGRITSVLSPRIWFLGVPVMLGLLFYRPSPLLVLIAIMAVPSLKKAWRYDPEAPENRAYYGIPAAKKAEYTAFYIALTACLALMTSVVHANLTGASVIPDTPAGRAASLAKSVNIAGPTLLGPYNTITGAKADGGTLKLEIRFNPNAPKGMFTDAFRRGIVLGVCKGQVWKDFVEKGGVLSIVMATADGQPLPPVTISSCPA
jgi:Zn-dependent protease